MKNYSLLSEYDLNVELVKACGRGDLDLAKYLTKSKDLNYHASIKYNRWEPIKAATSLGQLEIVKYYLDDIQNEYPNIVFNVACQNGQLEIIKYLFTISEFKNDKINRCITGSCLAASGGHIDVLDYFITSTEFLDMRKNLDYLIKNYKEIFSHASSKGQIHVIEYLFKIPELKNDKKNLCIIGGSIAATSGHVDALDYFIKASEVLDLKKNNLEVVTKNYLDLFVNSSGNGHLNIIQYLLNKQDITNNINVSDMANYGLYRACENNQMHILQYFIFELNMEYNDYIKNYLNGIGRDDIKELFHKRELSKQLESDLPKNTSTNIKIKV